MQAFTASLSFSSSRGSASESMICSVRAMLEALLSCYACRWPSPRCGKRVQVLEGDICLYCHWGFSGVQLGIAELQPHFPLPNAGAGHH